MGKILRNIAVCIFTLLSIMWISSWENIHIRNVKFTAGPHEPRSISLPFSENFVGRYTISIDLENLTSDSQEFRIKPDDEILGIRLNGQPISMEKISSADRRNYNAGFVVNLNNLQVNKINHLEFDIANESNPTGFNIEATQLLTKSQGAGIFFSLGVLILFLSRSLKISRLQMLFLFISLAVSLFYLSNTDPHTRTFDVYEGGGHKQYIEYLVEQKKLPNPGAGWEYHQPPLYYLIAASTKVIGHISVSASDLWGQLLGLYFWTIFLMSGLACLNLAFKKSAAPLLLSSFAVCLWPAGIIHSVRIGNDLPLYAFFTLSFFYTLKWWKTRASTDLFWAGIWMGASLLTKSNGLAMAATLGILFLLHTLSIYRNKERFQFQKSKLIKDFYIISSMVLIALSLNFGDNIYYYVKGSSSDWLLSNVSQSINSGLRVNNTPESYLIFDLATYLKHPFISTWEDSSGRQYFWNFLWRSSLSSEFSFPGNALKFWGISNGVLLLLTLTGAVIYFLQKQPYTSLNRFLLVSYKNMPWLLTLVFPFILLLAYRMKVPLSCNTDFRYIYPVLINIVFFACLSWKEPRKFFIPAILVSSLAFIGANSLLWIFNLQ